MSSKFQNLNCLQYCKTLFLTWCWKFSAFLLQLLVAGYCSVDFSNRIRMLALVRVNQVWVILFYKLTMVYIIQLTTDCVFCADYAFLYNLRQNDFVAERFLLFFQLPSFSLPGLTLIFLLHFSLWGNCMTTMIATCSLEKKNLDVSCI